MIKQTNSVYGEFWGCGRILTKNIIICMLCYIKFDMAYLNFGEMSIEIICLYVIIKMTKEYIQYITGNILFLNRCTKGILEKF